VLIHRQLPETPTVTKVIENMSDSVSDKNKRPRFVFILFAIRHIFHVIIYESFQYKIDELKKEIKFSYPPLKRWD